MSHMWAYACNAEVMLEDNPLVHHFSRFVLKSEDFTLEH